MCAVSVVCVASAKEAGITIVNEVGVDPGIDHMLAMQCFGDVKVRSGKVTAILCRIHQCRIQMGGGPTFSY